MAEQQDKLKTVTRAATQGADSSPTSASIILTTVISSTGPSPTDKQTSVVAINAPTQPPFTSSNAKLVAVTSALGGLVLVLFLVFVLYQLRRGRSLIDILKLRHSPRPEERDDRLLEPQEPTSLGSDAFIFKSQRFSIRSSRYTMSLHDNKLRRISQASQSPYKQYHDTYFLSNTNAVNQALVRKTSRNPPLPTLQTDLDELPRITTITRPEMAYKHDKSPLSASDISLAVHGVAEEVIVNKADPRHLRVGTKSVDEGITSVGKVQPERHSIIYGFKNARPLLPLQSSNSLQDNATNSGLDRPHLKLTFYTTIDSIDENMVSSVSELSAMPASPMSPGAKPRQRDDAL